MVFPGCVADCLPLCMAGYLLVLSASKLTSLSILPGKQLSSLCPPDYISWEGGNIFWHFTTEIQKWRSCFWCRGTTSPCQPAHSGFLSMEIGTELGGDPQLPHGARHWLSWCWPGFCEQRTHPQDKGCTRRQHSASAASPKPPNEGSATQKLFTPQLENHSFLPLQQFPLSSFVCPGRAAHTALQQLRFWFHISQQIMIIPCEQSVA